MNNSQSPSLVETATVNSPSKVSPKSLGLLKRLMILTVVHLLVGSVAILGAVQFEFVSFSMAMMAFGVCVISSLVAHLTGEYPTGEDYFMTRLVLSMMARSGLPFLAVIVVKTSARFEFSPGFVFLVILFYVVGLFVDILMQVARLNRQNEAAY